MSVETSNRKPKMNAYKEITVLRTERVWVKVMRKENKTFVFVVGYTNDFKGFKTVEYSNEFMPTIKDAKEFASTLAADYV